MKVVGWGASDVGRKRHHNEDSFLCSDRLSLYAVADGMGGHLGGERASRMAVEILEREIDRAWREGQLADRPPPQDDQESSDTGAGSAQVATFGGVLKRAVVEADRSIYEAALANPSLSGMGTTLTALLFGGGYVYLGHVGDSRAYLYRNGKARQLTEDHSWIQEQVRAGLLSPEEAKESRFRNIITRSVGFEPAVEPDLAGLSVQAGDCFVLCSDGLSNYLSVDEVGQVLTSHFYRDVAPIFVQMANDRGGDDNVTCLVVYAGNEK
jgi:protein phosphatase